MNDKPGINIVFEICLTLLAISAAAQAPVFILIFIGQFVSGGKGYLPHMI